MTLLRRSRLRLARLSSERFEDLATGETLPLLPTPPSDPIGNNAAFGRFTTTDDGYILATGTLVLLDDDALAVARGFVRPGGRGIGNPVRCAEAVYRHIIRNGASTANWRDPIGCCAAAASARRSISASRANPAPVPSRRMPGAAAGRCR